MLIPSHFQTPPAGESPFERVIEEHNNYYLVNTPSWRPQARCAGGDFRLSVYFGTVSIPLYWMAAKHYIQHGLQTKRH